MPHSARGENESEDASRCCCCCCCAGPGAISSADWLARGGRIIRGLSRVPPVPQSADRRPPLARELPSRLGPRRPTDRISYQPTQHLSTRHISPWHLGHLFAQSGNGQCLLWCPPGQQPIIAITRRPLSDPPSARRLWTDRERRRRAEGRTAIRVQVRECAAVSWSD